MMLAVVLVVSIPTICLPVEMAEPDDCIDELADRGGKPNNHPHGSERSAASDELRREQSTDNKDRCAHDEAGPRIVSIQQPSTAHDEDCHTRKPEPEPIRDERITCTADRTSPLPRSPARITT